MVRRAIAKPLHPIVGAVDKNIKTVPTKSVVQIHKTQV